MTGIPDENTNRAADIVYQDISRRNYIWIWCFHENRNYRVHRGDVNTQVNVSHYGSLQDIKAVLRNIEEEVNMTVYKPQWRRLKGEQIIVNVLSLYSNYADDDEDDEDDEVVCLDDL
jgi:hypothetical protein